MKTITLILSGSIASIRYNNLINTLTSKYQLNVIYTDSSKMFINQHEIITNKKIKNVFNDSFSVHDLRDIEHISLAKESDLVLIAPASHNYINSFANGIANTFSLSFLAVCEKEKVVIAPAMNTKMYENITIVENIEKLKRYGVRFIDPIMGLLSCGDVGIGKMELIDKIMYKVDSFLENEAKRKCIVTCGSTKLFLDPVRYISNKSSGTFGKKIALEFLKENYEVTLIHSVDVDVSEMPMNINFITFETNQELDDSINKVVKENDVIVMAAAPVDYDFQKEIEKIKTDKLELSLSKGKDIIRNVEGILKVGFALETSNHVENGLAKLKSKNLDMIFINDHKTMNSKEVHDAVIITKNSNTVIENKSKQEAAVEMVNIVNKMLNKN